MGDRPRFWICTIREEYDCATKTIAPLVAARDRAGLAALLHEWEAYSVKLMKLEKLWQPSPFPLELAGLEARDPGKALYVRP